MHSGHGVTVSVVMSAGFMSKPQITQTNYKCVSFTAFISLFIWLNKFKLLTLTLNAWLTVALRPLCVHNVNAISSTEIINYKKERNRFKDYNFDFFFLIYFIFSVLGFKAPQFIFYSRVKTHFLFFSIELNVKTNDEVHDFFGVTSGLHSMKWSSWEHKLHRLAALTKFPIKMFIFKR